MLPMPSLWTNVCRELGCAPTLECTNTDYDPGSVVSTAQSNNISCELVRLGMRHGMAEASGSSRGHGNTVSV